MEIARGCTSSVSIQPRAPAYVQLLLLYLGHHTQLLVSDASVHACRGCCWARNYSSRLGLLRFVPPVSLSSKTPASWGSSSPTALPLTIMGKHSPPARTNTPVLPTTQRSTDALQSQLPSTPRALLVDPSLPHPRIEACLLNTLTEVLSPLLEDVWGQNRKAATCFMVQEC